MDDPSTYFTPLRMSRPFSPGAGGGGGGSSPGTYWISDNSASPETPNYAQGTGDAGLQDTNPTTNFGTDTPFTISLPAGPIWNALVKFSGLANLTGPVTVTSVSLWLWNEQSFNDGPSTTADIYRVLRNWVETQATWNVFSTGNNWGTAGCENTTTDRSATSSGQIIVPDSEAGAWHEFTGAQLATDVANIINGVDSNLGWLVKDTGSGFVQFTSREGADGHRPRLSVLIA